MDWPAEEFGPHALTLANGEDVAMDLAERGTRLSNAGIGNDNPGRECLGIMFSRPFGRWRGQ